MNPDLLEKIEDFLEQRISKAELEDYAKENDVRDLNEKIEWFKESIMAIEADGLRDQLQDLFSDESLRIDPNKNSTLQKDYSSKQETKGSDEESKVRKLNPMRWLVSAAAALLIFAVGSYIFSSLNQSGSNLYAEYEYKDPGLPITMSQSDNYELYDALTYYEEENYETAEAKLSKLLSSKSTNDTLLYYIGACQFYQNKISLAKANLIQVEKDDQSIFNDKADWLIVLCHLKENKTAKAKEKAGKILQQEGHEFREKAEKLVKAVSP